VISLIKDVLQNLTTIEFVLRIEKALLLNFVEENFSGCCWNLWTGPMSSSLKMISLPNWSINWDWSNLGSIGKHRNLNIFWSWKFLEVDRSMVFRMIRFSWILIDFSELIPDSSKILQSPVHRIDREPSYDFGLPIAAQMKAKQDKFHSKVNVDMPVSEDNCIYHICPSKSMIASHWLIHQPPFTHVYIMIAWNIWCFRVIVSVFAALNSLKLLWPLWFE
jgi:hypothetical protein